MNEVTAVYNSCIYMSTLTYKQKGLKETLSSSLLPYKTRRSVLTVHIGTPEVYIDTTACIILKSAFKWLKGKLHSTSSTKYKVCVCMHYHTYLLIYTNIHTYIHTYIQIYTHLCSHMYIYSTIYSYVYSYIHLYINTYLITEIEQKEYDGDSICTLLCVERKCVSGMG